jgi:hypothetical protein
VVALLTAAYGGSPSSSGASDSASAGSSAVAYSACMRDHGAPNYPDPDSSGNLQKTSAQHLGVSYSAFNAAQRACHDKFPSNTGGSLADRVRQCYLPATVHRRWCSR